MVSDLYRLPHPLAPWLADAFLPADAAAAAATAGPEGVAVPRGVRHASALHRECVGAPAGEAVVVGLGAIESSFLYTVTRGLPGFGDPDTAPLLVATELLCAIEGPLWVNVRGLGLAYGFSMYGDAEEGLVYFSLARATNLPRAYAEARALVRAFVAGERPVEAVALENAAAAVISGVVSREQTVSACGLQSLMTALRGTGPGHNARLLRAVQAVTAGDVRRVLERYLGPLFEPMTANMCITAAAAKADEVAAGFQALGWAVRRETVDDAVAGGDGDGGEEEEEEEEEEGKESCE